jgi:hypothetical protein
MNSMALTPQSFLYVDTDVPVGQTLVGWRRDRDAARRPSRRRFSWLPNLRLRS